MAIKSRKVTRPDGSTTNVEIGSKADVRYGGTAAPSGGSSTSSTTSAPKGSSGSGGSSKVDTNYSLKPGESTADYNKRIDAYRMSDANPLKITSSSATEREEEKKMGSEILGYSAPTYTSPANNDKYLADMERFITQAESSALSGINNNYRQQITDTQGTQKREVGATSTSLARMGGYLGESGSGMGVMQNLVTGHRAEIAGLESKRQQAISESKEFYAQKRFDLAKEKLQEAKDREKEIYNRQQDFFNNQRLVAQDERTIVNQERDDARAVLTNIISNANGQSFDELDEETQAAVEDAATKAGYPLGVIQSMLEKPKALASKLDTLVKDAARKGAPASILSAIAEAGSFTEAASIAAPYLAAKSGGGSDSGLNADGGYGIAPEDVPTFDQFVIEFIQTPRGQEIRTQMEEAQRGSLSPEGLIRAMTSNETVKSIYQSTVDQVKSSSSSYAPAAFTPTEKKKLEQAGLIGRPRQEQLDYLFGKKDAASRLEALYAD